MKPSSAGSSAKFTAVKGAIQTLVGQLARDVQPRRWPWGFYAKFLLLGGLSLWALTGFVLPAQRKSAAAAEIELARASNPWSFASFPVENFQAYTSPFGYRQSPYGGQQFHY
ncbi:MAG: M23 family peptidase, partial [Cyanobacteria bacterium P01_D01_bin.2]